jgi:hypothetical protein
MVRRFCDETSVVMGAKSVSALYGALPNAATIVMLAVPMSKV